MAPIEIGKKAPDFSLPDQEGEVRTLKGYRGKPVVLYFYPKDNTSGCTKQACQFRDALPGFREAGAAVLGVSPDSSRSHAGFITKHRLGFTLLSDVPDAKGTPRVCEKFGVWAEKSMYGRKYMGVVRTTYLIDADGTVIDRWDKVKVPGHEREVFESLLAGGRGDNAGGASASEKPSAKKATKKTIRKAATGTAARKEAPAKKNAAKKGTVKKGTVKKGTAKKKTQKKVLKKKTTPKKSAGKKTSKKPAARKKSAKRSRTT